MITSNADRTECAADDREVVELVPDLDARALDARIRIADRRTDVGNRELAFYLAEMHERGLHQMLGFSSTLEYACKRLEMQRRHAQDLIAVGRALAELPRVDDAFCAGKLRWSRVRLLVRIAVPETEAAWLERALELPWKAFDREVATSERGRPPRQDRRGLPRVRIVVRGRLERVHYEAWEIAKKKLEAERGESMSDADCMAHAASLILGRTRDGASEVGERVDDSIFRVVMQRCPDCEKALLATPEGLEEVDDVVAACIACDAPSVDAEDPDHESKTPKAMRAKVLLRDGLACRICSSRQDLMAHHVVWDSRGGKTKPSNLSTVCSRCHGLVHEGLILMRGSAPKDLTITDRDGVSLNSAALVSGAVMTKLRRASRAARVRVAERACGASWTQGDEPDVALASIPAEPDVAWFDRHRHLFRWAEGRGEMAFQPGAPSAPVETDAATDAGPSPASCGPCLGHPSHRPSRLADVVGQSAAVHALVVAALAARRRNAAVDHVLLLGPPGLGKTSLAQALANEIGTRAHVATGPAIQDPGVLLRLLTSLRDRDVLFVDEIHALPRRVQEFLYEAMEDGRISLTVSDGRRSRSIRVSLPPFTLVGATTELGSLPEPFVSRFPIREHLGLYSEADLVAIVARTAVRERLSIDSDAAARLVSVARGVPRHALSMLRRVRDEVIAADGDRIDLAAVVRSLEAAGIDDLGLQPIERQALDALRRHGRPMGLARWAASAGLPPASIRRLCEPELFRQGLIVVTPRGRMARAQLCAEPSADLCRDGSARYGPGIRLMA